MSFNLEVDIVVSRAASPMHRAKAVGLRYGIIAGTGSGLTSWQNRSLPASMSYRFRS